ncbi:MAG TPA: M48 family metalloprotease [Terriglobales bacterium]|nr:M48 family metalloprotease [Terriglobales bacterium]
MKSIFNLRPVLTTVLLVSSFFWTNGSFAQSASSNDSKPAVAKTAPSTTIPAGSQSLPAASQTPPAASQPVPAATQPALTGDTQTSPSTATPAIANDQQPATTDAQQPAGTDAQQANQKDTFKHDGGKDDVDAIGNRKGVGGRGLGNWYSYEKEIALGKEYAQQIEASSKLVQDPVVNEYVNRVGQNLVRNSDAKVPFTIKVIDSDEVNAMALPGGFFYVNSGLILAADNEAELAGVMSHEIAHVCARHVTRQMTRSQWANFATLPLIFVGGGAGYAARLAADLLVPATFMKFSRGFEAEADHLGVQYMYHAGYDPQQFVSMFEKMESLEKKKPGTIAKIFASHPPTPDRIEATQKEISTILPPRDSYIVNTSEFDDVKSRLAALENKRKLDDSKDANKPTLRRASSSPDSTNPSDSSKTGDDDRPTLHRRDDDQH